MMTQSDWQWFRSHPDRTYRLRLASPAEVAVLEVDHALPPLAPNCFVFAISRINRPAVRIETILMVREPGGDLDEGDCMTAWYDADAMISALVQNGMMQ
jgi:hypothetical protein